MADERDDSEHTEDPTQKRLDEAIKRGDVVNSPEVNTWFMIAGGALTLMVFAGPMAQTLETTFRGLLANSYQIPADGPRLLDFAEGLAIRVAGRAGHPVPAADAGGDARQHDPAPHRVLGRADHAEAVEDLAGGRARPAVLEAGAGQFRQGPRQAHAVRRGDRRAAVAAAPAAAGLVGVDPAAILPFTQSLAMQMLGAVVAILAVVAAADYLFQYRQWYERQKMSVREMKEEFRQTEGDPMIKGKLRQMRQARVRKRMMAAVPKASIVITNPTHYAVALQYERGMNAPICVAKGVDLIARKIREVAEAHGIPVVENPPLARALHGTVEIDQEIPQEHYRAVAEIIGYVMRLRRLVAR